jgi:hypothetical protein
MNPRASRNASQRNWLERLGAACESGLTRLDESDESALYHRYEMNYNRGDAPSGRRLA